VTYPCDVLAEMGYQSAGREEEVSEQERIWHWPIMTMKERLYASMICWEGWQFVVVSSQEGTCYIDLCGTPLTELSRELHSTVVPDDYHNFPILHELREYLAGQRRAFSPPPYMQGTPFQRSVWDAVLEIPYGRTCSYSGIAAAIGRPRAARAVGGAVSANPLPIIVPCHRVIGKNGKLVGFGGGLALKERLLALEQGSLDL